MATESFSMKVEDTPLEAFLEAASDYRVEREKAGANFGSGAWGLALIGGVECRTMTWPVEAEVVHLVVAGNDDEELPTLAESGLTVVPANDADTPPDAA